MADNNETLELEITKYLVNYHQSAAKAIDDATNGIAIGAKATTHILKHTGNILDVAIIGTKYYNAAPADKNTVLLNEGTKWGMSSLATVAGTAVFLWTGPAAPIFGMAIGAAFSIGLEYAEAYTESQSGQGIGELLFNSQYSIPDINTPENGILTTEVKNSNGDVKFTIEQNTQTGELKYIKPNLDVTRFELDAAGNYKSLEITKDGNTVGFDFRTGDFNITDTNGVSHTGNFADTNLSTDAAVVLNKMLDDFNTEIQQTDPAFDVRTQIVDTIQGSSSDLTVQISGRKILISNDFSIDSQNSFGGTTIDYKGLSISTDSSGQSVVRTVNPATGETRGIFYNSDGTKTVFYSDENAVDGVAEYTFTNLSELGPKAQYQAQQVLMDATQTLRNGMRELLESNPELLGDLTMLNWPPELQDIVEATRQDVLANKADEGKTYDVTAETSTTSADGTVTYQKKTVGADIEVFQFSDTDLLFLAQNAPDEFADLRVGAFWELHARAIDSGAFSTNAEGNDVYTLPSGIYLEVVNTGDPTKTVELIKYTGVAKPIGVVTAYTDNFQQQVVEVLDTDSNSVIVDITTTDTSLNQAFTGGTVTLKYPETFVFNEVGGYVGNTLGQYLADGDLYKSVLYSAALKTVGQHTGTVLDFLANSTETLDSIFAGVFGSDTNTAQSGVQSLPDLFEGFTANLQAQLKSSLIGYVSGAIVDEIGEALEIDGVAGEVFDVVAGTVTTGVVSGGLDILFNGLEASVYTNLLAGDGVNFATKLSDLNLETPVNIPGVETVGDYVQYQVANALASYAGARLAGELIEPESEMAAVFGSLGSAIGTFIAGTSAAAGSTLASLQTALQLGTAFGPVGFAVGAFIGTIAGTVLGNLFGGEDDPAGGAYIAYNRSDAGYDVVRTWSDDGGDTNIAISMAEAAYNGVNHIIEMTQGNFRRTTEYQVEIGFNDDGYFVSENGVFTQFDGSGEAIKYAALKLLQGADIVGGHAILMRAWHNSEAVTLEEFQEDLMVAEAFQTYLLNPTAVLALMMDQPESEAAQHWAAILQRAAELELHLPHEKDIDGGWGEVLAARGDINPEAIPDIDGNDIVLTDPVTGEETVIRHVIGPGYEIIRIPGTDGNDIIEVIVDGASISYTDAGPGDDTFVGHDGVDIFIGGEGNDTANGGGGNDWLLGNEGDDALFGEAGDDLLVGGPGDDYLDGGPDQDEIRGSSGNDELYGDTGDDFIYGGAGDDMLQGHEGIDRLNGEAGNDLIYGEGYDLISGGVGDDIIHLSGNNNEVSIARREGHDTVYVDAGTGHSIKLEISISVKELKFYREGDDFLIEVPGENQTLRIFDAYNLPFASIPKLKFYDQAQQGTSNVRLYEYSLPIVLTQPDGSVVNDINTLAPNTNYYNDDYAVWNIVHGTDGDDFINDGNRDGWGIPSSSHFYGGAGNDTLYLGMGANYGVGGAGNDTIYGYTKNDLIWGGSGNDYIFADADNDVVSGGDGADEIYGWTGEDKLYGDTGDDQIYAGDGNDSVWGGDGDDFIWGDQSDTTTLSDEAGQDLIFGGDGDDIISGQGDDDRIYGDAGNDTLDGNEGNDVVSGGEGEDLLIFNVTENVGFENVYSGGEDVDTLRINMVAADYLMPLLEAELVRYNMEITRSDRGQATAQQSTLITTLLLTLIDFEQIEVFVDGVLQDISYNDFALTGQATSNAHDYITASDNNSITVNAQGGHDWVKGSVQGDSLHGGDGDDFIEGDNGDDFIEGDEGSDQLHGGQGADTIDGGAGNDLLFGEHGNDVLHGQAGTDEIDGGLGDDSIYGGNGDDTLYGEEGDDTISGGAGDDILLGGLGDDVLDGNDDDDVLYGGAGADTLTGGMGADTFVFRADTAFDAVDTIQTFDVNEDILDLHGVITGYHSLTDDLTGFVKITSDGSHSYLAVDLDGGADDFVQIATLENTANLPNVFSLFITGVLLLDDLIHVSLSDIPPSDFLSASGYNFYYGTSADNNMSGGFEYSSGDNGAFFSYGGNDQIYAGSWNDVVDAGDGDDYVDAGNWNDRVIAGSGNDVVDAGDGDDVVYGGLGDDIIAGQLGNDKLYGNEDDDIIEGGGGDDLLHGGSGDDSLDGGDGADTLYGGGGVDRLYGGAGTDTLIGTLGGIDTFVFRADTAYNGADTLRFFDSNEDVIDISDLLEGYDPLTDAITDFVHITGNGTHSYLRVDTNGGRDNFVQIAQISNVAELTDEKALETAGVLITA
ncbi:MAG: type I secretion C-terminal target domain-containing protein [Alphaproteobacteria bacterium]